MGIPPDIVLFVILLCFAKQGGCFPLTAAILGYSFVTVKQPVLKRCMMEKQPIGCSCRIQSHQSAFIYPQYGYSIS